jgi:hypothetical protein
MDSSGRAGESTCHDSVDLYRGEPFCRFSAMLEDELYSMAAAAKDENRPVCAIETSHGRLSDLSVQL